MNISGPIRSKISNRGAETVQLRTRHWRITDAFGRKQEVKGAGVVGKQPCSNPASSFEYTSGVPLPTPSGFMAGSYAWRRSTAERSKSLSDLLARQPQFEAHPQLISGSATRPLRL